VIPNIFDNKPTAEASGSVPFPDPLEAQFNRSASNEANVEQRLEKESQKEMIFKNVERIKQEEAEFTKKRQLEGKFLLGELVTDLNPASVQNMDKVLTSIGLEPTPKKPDKPVRVGEVFMPSGSGISINPGWSSLVTEELGKDAREFAVALPGMAESIFSLFMPSGGVNEAVRKGEVPYTSVIEPKGYKPKGKRVRKITDYFSSQLEGAKNIAGLAVWLPQNIVKFSKDPLGYVENNPLDAMFLMSAVAHGVKSAGKKPALSPREGARDMTMPGRDIPKPNIHPLEEPGLRYMREGIDVKKELEGAVKEAKPEDMLRPVGEPTATGSVPPPIPGSIQPPPLPGTVPPPVLGATKPVPSTPVAPGEILSPEGDLLPQKSGFNAEKALKKDAQIIGEKLRSTPADEVVHTLNKGTAEVYAKDIAPIVSGDIPDIDLGRNKLSRAFSYNLTPTIFRADKIAPFRTELYYPWRRADVNVHDMTLHVKKSIIPKWHKELAQEGSNPRKASERIAAMSIEAQEGGLEILQGMNRNDLIGLKPTKAEAKIMAAARPLYDFLFEAMNHSRKIAGMEPLKYVDNYFTFMRNMIDIKGEGFLESFEYAVPNNIKLGGIPFPWQKPRKFGDFGGVKLDFFDVFQQYAERAFKVIEITPIVGKGRALLEPMSFDAGKISEKTGNPVKSQWQMRHTHPNLSGWMNGWLNRIAEAPTPSPDGFGAIERGLSVLNKNQAFATLSGNFRSFFIQPTALRLSYVALKEKYMTEGFKQYAMDSRRKFAYETSDVLRNRNYDVHAKEIREGRPSHMVGVYKQKAGELGLVPLKVFDSFAAEVTWLGAYAKATELHKMSPLDAKHWADDMVIRTQASAKSGDISPLQAHTMGKIITAYQTFVINEWNQSLKNVYGVGNKGMSAAERVGNVSRMVLTTLAVNALFEGGLNIRSPFPAPEWAIAEGIGSGTDWKKTGTEALKEMVEPVPVIGGGIRYSSPEKSSLIPPALKSLGDAVSRSIGFLESGKFGVNEIDALGKILGIPGTSQLSKFLRRIKKGYNIPESVIGVRMEGDEKKKKSDWQIK